MPWSGSIRAASPFRSKRHSPTCGSTQRCFCRQLRPGETHFFPKIQYAGSPLTAKSRLFREAVDELIRRGWLFPPEDPADTKTRTYEYRGEKGNSAGRETVLIATPANIQADGGGSDYPAGTPVVGKYGFVLSPYASTAGYVDVRGFSTDALVRCPYTGKVFRVP
jgi:hypothetical protein